MTRAPMLTLALAALLLLMPPPAPAAELPDERTLYIAPGQSLSSIVRTLYPDHRGQWALITEWIVAENPHAFRGEDPEAMRSEVRVRIPGRSELERVPEAAQPETGGAAAERARGGESETALVFGERYLFVNPAQSLTELVPRLYAGHEQFWDRIIEAIIERNADRLQALARDDTVARGTRLQIPEVIPAESAGTAVTDAGATPAPEPENSVGVFRIVRGEVEVVSRYSRMRSAAADHPVRLGDRIATGAGARAVIELDDGEEIHVRPGSRLRIREWELPDTGPGSRVIELLEGGMRAITGAIGNRGNDVYRTVTPNATMGVRGTDYSLRLCGAYECAGATAGNAAPGLYAGVHRGGISLLNEAGELHIAAGEYGHVREAAAEPRRVDARQVAHLLAAADIDEAARPEPRSESEADEDGSAWTWLLSIGALILIGVAL